MSKFSEVHVHVHPFHHLNELLSVNSSLALADQTNIVTNLKTSLYSLFLSREVIGELLVLRKLETGIRSETECLMRMADLRCNHNLD
mgnify:CR=1 FL=1